MKRNEAIKQLESLDTIVLVRLANLSKEQKALSYFKSALKYGALLTILKSVKE